MVTMVENVNVISMNAKTKSTTVTKMQSALILRVDSNANAKPITMATAHIVKVSITRLKPRD